MSLLADGPVGSLRVAPVVEAQRGELLRLLAADPLVGAPVEARVRAAQTVGAGRLGGPLHGVTDPAGRLRAVLLDCGAAQPVGGGPGEWDALAAHLVGTPRRCSSIVGRADAVDALWERLARFWGAPRERRPRQPLLVAERPPEGGHPDVRPVRLAELDAYLPAAEAMFREELGISPTRGAGGEREYRARVASLISARRAYALFDGDGRVVFKADLGVVTDATCQVQGVWTRPELRGRGVATSAMAVVLRAALGLAPTVSLYVNDFNEAARRLYARLGMTEHAVLSTILF